MEETHVLGSGSWTEITALLWSVPVTVYLLSHPIRINERHVGET